LLTRIGDDSKIIVAGDIAQHDRGFENNGLSDLISRILNSSNDIAHINFSENDIVRNQVIKEILSMYSK
jgi:phosphate starvation-inducible protein PhoH